MLAWIIALLSVAHATDPLRINVSDPTVRKVLLDCGSTQLEADVRGGVATFAQNPGKCEVLFLSVVGKVDAPGEYNCAGNGCAQMDVHHKPIETAAGRVTIVITDNSTTMLEMKCPTSGYRMRARVDTNTAVFDNVPEEDCEMFWKGGTVPAKARDIRPGTWYCQATGGTGVCTRK